MPALRGKLKCVRKTNTQMTVISVVSNHALTSETFVLRTNKLEHPLVAGQCFSIGVPHVAINREYSIYSGSSEPHYDFLIRRVEGGIVSNALSELKAGDVVDLWGPFGAFTLDQHSILKNKFVFIASGTGIAPFHSFVRSYPNLDYQILHGIRYESEQYDRDDYNEGAYFPCVSRPTSAGKPMRVTDLIEKLEISGDETFYLCGNRNMINDSISLLRRKGINGNQIFTETFF